MQQAITRMHNLTSTQNALLCIDQIARATFFLPVIGRLMREQTAEGLKHCQTFAFLRHAQGAENI